METPEGLKSVRAEAERLSVDVLGGHITAINSLGKGYGGDVFKVSLEGGRTEECVVKIIHTGSEVPFSEELDDDRVYGARPSNFKSAYDLLQIHDIPVPEVFRYDATEEANRIVMEFLPGISVHEYSTTYSTDEDIQNLHECVGMWLGKLHSISRLYQGWVHMQEPYTKNWKDAFFDSLKHRLKEVVDSNLLANEMHTAIEDFVQEQENFFEEPKQYVFSHVDGFQGFVRKKDTVWELTGLIDIEDHQFTDQRFSLAGYELGAELSEDSLPPSFWETYQEHVSIPASYADTKNLFKLYYLLTWRRVFHDSWSGDKSEQYQKIAAIENKIKELLS